MDGQSLRPLIHEQKPVVREEPEAMEAEEA